MPQGENFKGKRPEGAGRKPGSENRIKGELRLKLAAAYEGMTDGILGMVDDPSVPYAVKVDIWKTLGKKVLPDLTATTLNPDADGAPQAIQITLGALPTHDDAGNPL